MHSTRNLQSDKAAYSPWTYAIQKSFRETSYLLFTISRYQRFLRASAHATSSDGIWRKSQPSAIPPELLTRRPGDPLFQSSQILKSSGLSRVSSLLWVSALERVKSLSQRRPLVVGQTFRLCRRASARRGTLRQPRERLAILSPVIFPHPPQSGEPPFSRMPPSFRRARNFKFARKWLFSSVVLFARSGSRRWLNNQSPFSTSMTTSTNWRRSWISSGVVVEYVYDPARQHHSNQTFRRFNRCTHHFSTSRR